MPQVRDREGGGGLVQIWKKIRRTSTSTAALTYCSFAYKNRCRPPARQQQAEDSDLMSLVDICVDELCKNIMLYEPPVPFDCLPPDLVQRVLDSLRNHKALTKLTVR